MLIVAKIRKYLFNQKKVDQFIVENVYQNIEVKDFKLILFKVI